MHETDWAAVAIGGGCFSFLASLLLQILVWRGARVRKQMLWLIVIHLALPVTITFLLAACRAELSPWLALAAFQTSLGSAFVMTFPAIQAQSPSLAIVLWLWRRGSCRREQLVGHWDDAKLVDDRRQDLAADGLVRPDGSLSAGGRLLCAFFSWYRKAMRVPEEQG